MRDLRLTCFAWLALSTLGCGVPAGLIPDPDPASEEAEDAAVASSDGAAGEAALTARADGALGTPRPLAPLAGATVTANPPTFHWMLPPGLVGARVQICADRACRSVEREADLAGAYGKAPRALLPGVHYYRLLGLSTNAHGTAPSATIPFTVRRVSASVDTSWGSAPDFDGDGYADLAVASQDGVSVFAGRALGVPRAPTKTIAAAPAAIASAGDVDGDGFVDLLVGTSIFRGSASGLGSAPAYGIQSANARGVGDLNGDGFADLATVDEGRLLVFYGRANGGPTLGTSIPSSGAEPFAIVAAAGDVNGDGYADVLVARSGESGSVEFHTGGPYGVSVQPTVTIAGHAASIAGAGDVNGDGYADVAIAEPSGTLVSPWRVRIHLGGKDGLAARPATTLVAPGYAGAKGPVLASAGDVNGDGFDDLLVGSPETLIGAPTTQPLMVRAALYFGSFVGPVSTGAQLFTLPALVSDYGGTFGSFVGGIGDFDGDGFADIALGVAQTYVPSFPAPFVANYLYVHEGTALGAWAAPTFRLDARDTTFGTSFAARF